MRYLNVLILLCVLLGETASAQSGFWRDATGKAVQETESMRSKDGFAGSLLATMDEDWQTKWETPPSNRPSFNKADVVPYGKKVYILTFFANPKKDDLGNVKILCDLSIKSPMGKQTLSQKGANCFSGKISGSSYNMYLSELVIAFSGDPGDPTGIWAIEVTLRDAVRGVELPLRTTFQLKVAK